MNTDDLLCRVSYTVNYVYTLFHRSIYLLMSRQLVLLNWKMESLLVALISTSYLARASYVALHVVPLCKHDLIDLVSYPAHDLLYETLTRLNIRVFVIKFWYRYNALDGIGAHWEGVQYFSHGSCIQNAYLNISRDDRHIISWPCHHTSSRLIALQVWVRVGESLGNFCRHKPQGWTRWHIMVDTIVT